MGYFEDIDTGHQNKLEDLNFEFFADIMRKTDLDKDEIFVNIFCSNGRGHFMAVEGPASKTKLMEGKQFHLTHHVKDKVSEKSLYFYREIDLSWEPNIV